MKYLQLICCFNPICSSLADDAQNDHKMKYNSNHGQKKKKKTEKKTDSINVYS